MDINELKNKLKKVNKTIKQIRTERRILLRAYRTWKELQTELRYNIKRLKDEEQKLSG